MHLLCILPIFQKVSGEGGGRNEIRAGGQHRHIVKIRYTQLHHIHAVICGEITLILTENENIQPVAGFGSGFNEISVTLGKGVAVHHRRTHRTIARHRGEGGQKLLQAVLLVLHQRYL